jgi:nitrogen fixation protein NifZ
MTLPRIHKFDWGQQVIAHAHLYNDGSYPECGADALLVEQGTPGEVVQVGMHEVTETPVYLVEFPGQRVIGCLEQDIASR